MPSFKSQKTWGPKPLINKFTPSLLAPYENNGVTFRQSLIISRNTRAHQTLKLTKGSPAFTTTNCSKQIAKGSLQQKVEFHTFSEIQVYLACLAQCLRLRGLSMSRNPFDQNLEVSRNNSTNPHFTDQGQVYLRTYLPILNRCQSGVLASSPWHCTMLPLSIPDKGGSSITYAVLRDLIYMKVDRHIFEKAKNA